MFFLRTLLNTKIYFMNEFTLQSDFVISILTIQDRNFITIIKSRDFSSLLGMRAIELF